MKTPYFPTLGLMLLIAGVVNGQNTGIGTATPSAQLHTTGTLRFQNYPSMVLSTDASGNVTAATVSTTPNIYTADGTLAGNRFVNIGSNTLNFSNGTSYARFNHSATQANLYLSASTRSIIQAEAGSGGTLSTMYLMQDAAGASRLQATNASTQLLIGTATGSTAPVYLATNGSTALTILNGGNVGIGTITPSAQLHTTGTVRFANYPSMTLATDASGNLTAATASSTPNIYTANGTLTGARTVTQGANTLSFTSTATNGFSVDGTTLSVDAANDRVGIGTSTPNAMLDVAGTAFFGTTTNRLAIQNHALGHRIFADGSGTLKPIAFNPSFESDIQFFTNIIMKSSTGNVGIGTITPSAQLHTTGGVRFANYPSMNLATDASGNLTAATYSNTPNIYTADGTLTGNRVVTQNANTLAFTSTATNGFSVGGSTFSVDAANARIGIGTTAPTAQLHTTGNVIVGSASGTSAGTTYSTVMRDNTTGELKTATSSTGNTMPLNYITYTLSNVGGDWVSDYDTKINYTDYTVIVVEASFSNPLTALGGDFNPKNTYAFKSASTWHLYADYTSANAASNGTWTFQCMVINNSMIKTLTSISQNLGGSTNGSAAAQPAGL